MRRRDLLVAGAALLLVRQALAQDRVRPDVQKRRAGERIVAGPGETIVFVVERDALLLRQNSTLELVRQGFRLVTGAVLSVFSPGGRRELKTATATIGIRGTGVYLEAEPARTYVCTCYGEAVLEPVDAPGSRETVRTRHHEQPRYIMARGAPQMVMPAPVRNHSDAELEMLEALVGREPPFKGQGFPQYGR
jgi:hypothetical protein